MLKNYISHLNELDAFELWTDDYVIGGSAAIIACGFVQSVPEMLHRGNDDIDVFVDQETLERLKPKLICVNGIWKNQTGPLDFGPENNDSYKKYKDYRMLVDGYVFMSKRGLVDFYAYLWETYKQPKHFKTWSMLKSLDQ